MTAAATDLCDLSLGEVAAAIRARRLSSLEATDACLARLAKFGGADGLACVVRIDADEARAAAKAADEALAKGGPAGPLHGVPLAHKDMYDRKGRPTGGGSRFLGRNPVAATATAVARLDAAGALDLGRLGMVEFALGMTGHNEIAGTARNPWNRDYAPGGSSSGPAAAVGGRLVFGALGSDTGGSIRFPAACCGLFGLKPTYGRVSRAGAMPLSFSLDTVGPLVRTAADSALMLQAIAGHDPADAASSRRAVPDFLGPIEDGARDLRIGVPRSYFRDRLDGEVGALIDDSLDVYRRIGARVVAVDLPDLSAANPLNALITACEGAAAHGRWLKDHAADYGGQTYGRLLAGALAPATAYIDALCYRKALLDEFCKTVFAACDLLHTPVLTTPVPRLADCDLGADSGFSEMIVAMGHCTRPINFLGLPAASVPCGFTENGLPSAFQLVGRPFDEATVLRAGRAYEREAGWIEKKPALR